MKLLPCPFCGGYPISEQNKKNSWVVRCSNCSVQFHVGVYRLTLDWAKETCENKWNTRTKAEGGDEKK